MISTFRVSDERARLCQLPMGKLIRHLVRDTHFLGRPDEDNLEWVVRLDDDGSSVQGYVRASLLEKLETSFGVVSNRRASRAFPPGPPPRDLGYVRAGTYQVTNPDGAAQQITNLAAFCRANGLSDNGMYAVVVGRQPAHQGWKAKRI